MKKFLLKGIKIIFPIVALILCVYLTTQLNFDGNYKTVNIYFSVAWILSLIGSVFLNAKNKAFFIGVLVVLSVILTAIVTMIIMALSGNDFVLAVFFFTSPLFAPYMPITYGLGTNEIAYVFVLAFFVPLISLLAGRFSFQKKSKEKQQIL